MLCTCCSTTEIQTIIQVVSCHAVGIDGTADTTQRLADSELAVSVYYIADTFTKVLGTSVAEVAVAKLSNSCSSGTSDVSLKPCNVCAC